VALEEFRTQRLPLHSLAFLLRLRHECEGRSVRAVRRRFLDNHSQDSAIRLGKAAITVQRGKKTSRFELRTASLSWTPGRRPVRLCLEGTSGSVIIELSRIAFWRLTAEFHERSIAAPDCPTSNTRDPNGHD
jgi:hypothetical protein